MNLKSHDLKLIDFRPLSTLNTVNLLKNQQKVIESSKSSDKDENRNEEPEELSEVINNQQTNI